MLTTAPTNNQVRNILWRNIGAAYRSSKGPLLGRCLTTQIDVAPDWYALGFKADDTASDRFQGFHAEHALVVIDEAAGVDDRVYDALDAVMTSEQARMLLIGNPTNPVGTFYEAFHGARSLYRCITITAADTPNMTAGRTVRPYLITQAWIDDAITKHGAGSPYVTARVHAEFPAVSDNNLIPLAHVEAADARLPETDPLPAGSGDLEAGLDVARMGTDESALCVRRGHQIVSEDAWSGMDTMETVGKVRHQLPDPSLLAAIKVDVIGIGAGVADRLREAGYPVVDVNVSSRSSDPEQWPNLRHELWWNIRERFREGTIGGPIDGATMGQLSNVRYRYDSRHTKPLIESKDDMRKRGVRSPDRAEALMLAFTNPPKAPGLAPDFDFAAAFAAGGIL
ncbi:hypothetical protein [Iamia sp.]|uniref:hypothetical protein n=1 Tax=Iamia sp. TaxID=2722710 RepID=UPI002D7FEB6C|nr:hypothetical protein [Iamia sp.]